jgi:hypothetical protein
MRTTMMTCAAVLMAATGYAQDEAARRAATEVAARVPLERAMKGAPYSAETIVEGTQQLADGNRISRKTTGRVYRDGEGRTRREDDRPNGAVTISITDPVAGFSYSLDPQNKVAWRTPIGAAGAIVRRFESTTAPDGSTVVGFETRKAEVEAAAREARKQGSEDEQSMKAKVAERQAAEIAASGGGGGGRGGGFATTAPVETPRGGGGGGGRGGAVAMPRTAMPTMNPAAAGPLEHKVIDGIQVEGRRTTTVIPAGQIGNEQPITITSEQWRSPDLNVLVMTRHSDPRTGDSVYRLQNIIRAEPDRSLFMVPADYTVKDTGIRRMVGKEILEGKIFEPTMRK